MKKNLAIIITLLSTQFAFADNVNNVTKSTATLSAKCEVSVSDANFGTIVPGQASSTTTTTFTTKCTKGTSFSYWIGIRQWGTDCSYMSGKNSGDRIMYNVTNLQNGVVGANNIAGTGGGSKTTTTGTGVEQLLNFKWIINPSGSYTCPTGVKGIGNTNPYVTPDIYSDTVTFAVSY